jgi:ATP-dependent DNA helicase RecG
MRAEDKDKVMREFRDGEIDILVSTTVIEVGIDIPNASLMLIEHVERFGLSGLHQLRGRIGRGAAKSYCILMGTPKTDEAKARVRAMVETQDGFKLAEVDLKLRGPGDYFGVRQSGLPAFMVADIIKDEKILRMAREAAFGIVKDDPMLEFMEHQRCKNKLLAEYGDTVGMERLD